MSDLNLDTPGDPDEETVVFGDDPSQTESQLIGGDEEPDGDGAAQDVVDPLTQPVPTDEVSLDDLPSDGVAPGVIPDDGSMPDWYQDIVWSQTQSVNGFCVPVSVAMIINQFRGDPVDQIGEMEAVGAALDLKLIEINADGTASGMTADQAEQLIEHFGKDYDPPVTAHVGHGGTIDDLGRWVDEGRKILIGVDSDEIWTPGDDDLSAADRGPDHALVVAEIIRDASGAPVSVVLLDPGNPQTPIPVMPIEEFRDAWADSFNEYVVTDVAAPESPVDIADTPFFAPAAEEGAQPSAPAAPEPVVAPAAPEPAVAIAAGLDVPEGEGIGVWPAAAAGPVAGAILLPIYLRFLKGRAAPR